MFSLTPEVLIDPLNLNYKLYFKLATHSDITLSKWSVDLIHHHSHLNNVCINGFTGIAWGTWSVDSLVNPVIRWCHCENQWCDMTRRCPLPYPNPNYWKVWWRWEFMWFEISKWRIAIQQISWVKHSDIPYEGSLLINIHEHDIVFLHVWAYFTVMVMICSYSQWNGD